MDSELALPAANAALQMLHVFPIPRKKFKKCHCVEKKLDRTRDVMKQALGVSDVQDTSSDKLRYAQTISLLKEKFHSTSVINAERIRILTLVPNTWSNVQVSEEFGTTLYMAKKQENC